MLSIWLDDEAVEMTHLAQCVEKLGREIRFFRQESWPPPKSTGYDAKWTHMHAFIQLKYPKIFNMVEDGATMQSFVGLDRPMVRLECHGCVVKVNVAFSEISLLSNRGR